MFSSKIDYLSRGKDSLVSNFKYYKSPTEKIDIVNKCIKNKDFNKEVRRLKNIDHPHLERIFVIWTYGNATYLFCEKLYKTFSRISAIKDTTHELSLIIQLKEGLKYLHSRFRVAHCDIKENNIMIDETEQRVKIIDFNNCMPERVFGTFELGIVLSKKHKDLFIEPKKWSYNVDYWALGCTIFKIKHKTDIIDEFLKINNLTYNQVEDLKKICKTHFNLYNFYLNKISQFKLTEQLIYCCLRYESIVSFEKCLKNFVEFHNIDYSL